MKREKKAGVSWPSDSMLCQVKVFLSEDIPAKVSSQTSNAPKASTMNILPPGFEAIQYATRRPNMSHIPRIKWNPPPKYILNDALRVGSGGDSTETLVENLRISKVFEAFYPHRSAVPKSPSVSQVVEDENYDDNKTPNIPVEEENEDALPAAVSGVGPDMAMAISAALSALMKTKEEGSLVDADLLVKLLSDPNIVKNLMNEMASGKPLEIANNTPNTSIIKPCVTPQQGTSPPITQPGNGVPHYVPVSVQPIVSVATYQPLSKTAQPVSSVLAMCTSIQKPPSVSHTYPLSSRPNPVARVQDSYTSAPFKPSTVDAIVVSQPNTALQYQSQSFNISTSNTWNTNKVLESGPTGRNPQIKISAYPMKINRDDQVSAKPPIKNLEYFKSLIREHGGGTPTPETNESNHNKAWVVNNKAKVVKAKFQKPCMYFGRGRGCKLGESCLYLHDSSKRSWTSNVAAEFPRAKRHKFGE